MKVLLYSEGMKWIHKSGLGRAIDHQKQALTFSGVSFTTERTDSFDCVHINTYFLKSLLLAKRMRRKGVPVIYHGHSTEEDFRNSFLFSNFFSPLFRKWIVYCYNHGDVVITPTPYAKRLLEQSGVTKPIYPVSNGINLSYYQQNPEMRCNFRKEYGFSDSDKVIMSVGLYIKRKGLLDFVEIAKKMPEYQFIWFGYLDLKQVPKEIRNAVHTELPNLIFAGYVSPEKLREAYAGSDLFFFPTYEETEGIVLLEAMAMRQTCLIRDIPIYEEYLHMKDVYKGKTNEEFIKLIQGIIKGELPRLTEQSLKNVEERDIEKIGSQLVNVYREAIQLSVKLYEK